MPLCSSFQEQQTFHVLVLLLVNESSQERTECVQKCTGMTPKVVSTSRMNVMKSGMNKMLQMKFAKKASKLNYMLSALAKSLNFSVKLNQKFKEEIKSELNLLNELENQNLLADALLGNKMLCGGETKFQVFIDRMNNGMNNDSSVHGRRHDDKLCSSR